MKQRMNKRTGEAAVHHAHYRQVVEKNEIGFKMSIIGIYRCTRVSFYLKNGYEIFLTISSLLR